MLHREITQLVITGFHQVYNELGLGFLESVYERATAIALEDLGAHVQRQLAIDARFRGHNVGDFYADLVVEDLVLVELKSCRALHSAHDAQILNYLRASKYEVGMLLNFGPKPVFRRFVYANERKHPPRGPAQRAPA